MRLSAGTPLALLVAMILLLGADAGLFLAYRGLRQEQDRLAPQVTMVEEALRRLPPPPPDPDPFPRTLPSVTVMATVLQAARASGVQVQRIEASPIAQERLGTGVYQVHRLSVAIQGQPAQIAAFFGQIAQSPLRTWVIDNVELQPAGQEWVAVGEIAVYALER